MRGRRAGLQQMVEIALHFRRIKLAFGGKDKRNSPAIRLRFAATGLTALHRPIAVLCLKNALRGRVVLRQLRTVAALATILPFAACAREERPAPPLPVSEGRPLPKPSPGPAASEADFVSENGSIDLFVIRSSELALQRSSSARVRDFAETMIEDHKGTSAQLSLEGRRLNLLPSATLRPGEQAMFDGLASSGRFDADYVRDERIVHERAVALDQAYATNGRSPTLRPVAAAALPIERRHLRLIAYL